MVVLSEDIEWDGRPALWLKVDCANPLKYFDSVERALDAFRNAAQAEREDDFRDYVIDFSWRRVVIIPLVRGRMLRPYAWSLPSQALLQIKVADLHWTHLIPEVLDDAMLTALDLTTWSEPQLEAGWELHRSAAILTSLAGHLRDIGRIPGDIDDLGTDFLQGYVGTLNPQLSQALQTMFASMTIILETYQSISPGLRDKRTHLCETVQTLVSMQRDILPDVFTGEMEVPLSEMGQLADRLETARSFALDAFLSWTADVLDQVAALPQGPGQ